MNSTKLIAGLMLISMATMSWTVFPLNKKTGLGRGCTGTLEI